MVTYGAFDVAPWLRLGRVSCRSLKPQSRGNRSSCTYCVVVCFGVIFSYSTAQVLRHSYCYDRTSFSQRTEKRIVYDALIVLIICRFCAFKPFHVFLRSNSHANCSVGRQSSTTLLREYCWDSELETLFLHLSEVKFFLQIVSTNSFYPSYSLKRRQFYMIFFTKNAREKEECSIVHFRRLWEGLLMETLRFNLTCGLSSFMNCKASAQPLENCNNLAARAGFFAFVGPEVDFLKAVHCRSASLSCSTRCFSSSSRFSNLHGPPAFSKVFSKL